MQPRPVDSPEFTEEDHAAFSAYETVRQQGKWNMFDPRARKATKLSVERYRFVVGNYSQLAKRFKP